MNTPGSTASFGPLRGTNILSLLRLRLRLSGTDSEWAVLTVLTVLLLVVLLATKAFWW